MAVACIIERRSDPFNDHYASPLHNTCHRHAHTIHACSVPDKAQDRVSSAPGYTDVHCHEVYSIQASHTEFHAR